MLRLILAVSSNGLLARGQNDLMDWPHDAVDKRIFKLLTMSSPTSPLLAGTKTFNNLRDSTRTRVEQHIFPGRIFIRISSQPSYNSITLQEAAARYNDGWLIGGPTVAAEALRLGLVSLLFLCKSSETLQPFDGEQGIWLNDGIRQYLEPTKTKSAIVFREPPRDGDRRSGGEVLVHIYDFQTKDKS